MLDKLEVVNDFLSEVFKETQIQMVRRGINPDEIEEHYDDTPLYCECYTDAVTVVKNEYERKYKTLRINDKVKVPTLNFFNTGKVIRSNTTSLYDVLVRMDEPENYVRPFKREELELIED